MQQSAARADSALPPSFAGVLAQLANPEKKFPPARDLDGLEDDVATLSYESALRAARVAVSEAGQHAAPRPVPVPSAMKESPRAEQPAAPVPAFTHTVEDPASLASVEANRKSASITIRLSQPEAEQLRQRASEAGMTISAYLRSCAFEVESLRAQVKTTLAEMKAVNQRPPAEEKRKKPAFSVWKRLWARFVPPPRRAVLNA